MGASPSHIVVIHISNRTRSITLRSPMTYLYCGHCSVPPRVVLPPGFSDTSDFSARFMFWGVAGVLVYEAESFTLAIHFSNSTDDKLSKELGLELSPGKAHLGSLEDTYTRMANGTYSSSHPDIKFHRIIVDKSHGTVQVSDGPVKVTATMSNNTHPFVRVVLEEQGKEGEEGGIEKPCRRRHIQEK